MSAAFFAHFSADSLVFYYAVNASEAANGRLVIAYAASSAITVTVTREAAPVESEPEETEPEDDKIPETGSTMASVIAAAIVSAMSVVALPVIKRRSRK